MEENEERIYTDHEAMTVRTVHGYASSWKLALASAAKRGYCFQADGIQGDTVRKTYIGENPKAAEYLGKQGWKKERLAEGVVLNPYNKRNEGKLINDNGTWRNKRETPWNKPRTGHFPQSKPQRDGRITR